MSVLVIELDVESRCSGPNITAMARAVALVAMQIVELSGSGGAKSASCAGAELADRLAGAVGDETTSDATAGRAVLYT